MTASLAAPKQGSLCRLHDLTDGVVGNRWWSIAYVWVCIGESALACSDPMEQVMA